MLEIEAKFYIANLEALQTTLVACGAQLVDPRVLETNLRFDTTGDELQANHRVLRLRKDHGAHLTYKDDARIEDGAQVRREIEFEVSDFSAARQLLEALGYEVVIIYEKYRTTYKLDDCEVVLDELPIGNFCEIEGVDVARVQHVSEILGLYWHNSIPISYLALFDGLKNRKRLKMENLTFQAFARHKVTAEDLDVIPANSFFS